MTKHLKDREWQDLSAYLDGQLSTREVAHLERELTGREDLRAALEDLRRVRIILRSQPRLRAPRNFTLRPEFAGVGAGHQPARRLSPVFGLVSALASVFLILVVAAEFLLGGAQRAAAPLAADTLAKSVQSEAVVSPTQAAAVEAPAMPIIQEAAPVITSQLSLAQEATQVERNALTEQAPSAAGSVEYPAPLSSAAGAAAYPTPTSQAPGALALQPTQSPTPIPTQETFAVAEAPPAAPAGEAAGESDTGERAPQPRPFWNAWRGAEIGLILLALFSGLFALYLRRARMK